MDIRNRYVNFSWLMTVLFLLTSVTSKGMIAWSDTVTQSKVQDNPNSVALAGFKNTQLVADSGTDNVVMVKEQGSKEDPFEKALMLLQSARNQIANFNPEVFKNPTMQKELLSKYDAVLENFESKKCGKYECVLNQLEIDILPKIDGCKLFCEWPDDNDWIIVCEAQRLVYDDTEEAREIIKRELILSIISCCISGYVKEWNPASGTYKGVGGASVTLSGGRGSATTASNGYYAMFPACGLCNVTATLPAPDGRSQQKNANLGCPGVNFYFSYQP